MDCRVYYGEFSLRHWIHMLVTKNLVLPEYQRSFVWEENDVKRLIKSIQDGQFVLPVTIALFRTGDDISAKNMIIDGQQRLSSILLACLGFMPNKSRFERPEILATDEDDSQDEADDGKSHEDGYGPIKWTFNELFSEGEDNSISSIKQRLNGNKKYNPLSLDLQDDFFDNRFLGYSYIVPNTVDPVIIQGGFSKLFRDINYFGKKLSALESRRSLYFMKSSLRSFFEGLDPDDNDVFCGISLIDQLQPIKIDLVRYLSILSQYSLSENKNKVLVGYSASSSRESFYADYVSYILGLDQERLTDKFNDFSMETVFPEDCWRERYKAFREALEKLKGKFELNANAFKSWIDADYWLFGLLFHLVFKGKTLKENLDGIDTTINNEIKEKKAVVSYSKSPNRLVNLRERLDRSITIIRDYVL